MADAAGHPPTQEADAAAPAAAARSGGRKRKQVAPDAEHPAPTTAAPKPNVESVLDALAGGREPSAVLDDAVVKLRRLDCSMVDGIDDWEGDAFLITEPAQLSLFLPKRMTRQPKLPLLLNWKFVKLLPLDWYRLVFPLSWQPERYRTAAASKLRLDGYPQAATKGDDDTSAGFRSANDLRIMLSPNALRFFCAPHSLTSGEATFFLREVGSSRGPRGQIARELLLAHCLLDLVGAKAGRLRARRPAATEGGGGASAGCAQV